jgi:very-short-patch-repair endonuclease
MDKTFNLRKTKRQRQYLRRNMTKGEKLLSGKLRGSRLKGLKFRRQCGIGIYIVDFYCPELKLAIEIDGDVHGYEIRRTTDVDREKSLQKLGIKLLRFTNGDVIESMSAVVEHILSNHPLTPSLSKEGQMVEPLLIPVRGNMVKDPDE